MNVFEYTDYKRCVNDWLVEQPKRGYGIASKMAEFLGVNSVLISQTLKGNRDFTLEQAIKLSKFIGLSTLEADYFLLLVSERRAGSHELKQIYQRQIETLRKQSQALKNRIEHHQLTVEDQSIFYSDWSYLGAWLALTMSKFSSIQKLAAHFHLPERKLAEVVRFLLDRGLLQKTADGFDSKEDVLHVGHDSPHVTKHHLNWRIKAIQMMDQRNDNNLFYTAPMVISSELKKKIRERLVKMIQSNTREAPAAPPEELVCLNIDFFEI